MVPITQFHVIRSQIRRNQIIHIKIDDILDVTIALVANVSLNHFIYNKGVNTPEKMATNIIMAIFLFGNVYIRLTSGKSQKKTIAAKTAKTCEKRITVSGIVHCNKNLLKIE